MLFCFLKKLIFSSPLSKQEHECLVEGPLNNLKQSMVQFQKPKKVGVKGFDSVDLSAL